MDAARDLSGLIARARAGAEIVIESGSEEFALLRRRVPGRRTMAECIALLPEDSTATIDEDFAADLADAIAEHRESLQPHGIESAWAGYSIPPS
jgi:hypothetical protein